MSGTSGWKPYFRGNRSDIAGRTLCSSILTMSVICSIHLQKSHTIPRTQPKSQCKIFILQSLVVFCVSIVCQAAWSISEGFYFCEMSGDIKQDTFCP